MNEKKIEKLYELMEIAKKSMTQRPPLLYVGRFLNLRIIPKIKIDGGVEWKIR